MKDEKFFSVVIPVYNSESSLGILAQKLQNVFTNMKKTYEIIFVNDNSTDDSLKILKKIKEKDNNIIIIDLLKNVGQPNAILCGLNFCNGKYIITMDDDLQNPPEEIPKLYNKILEGFDVVIGSSKKRKHNVFKRISSSLVRKINHLAFNSKNLRFSGFRIIKKEIVDLIKDSTTKYPHITGLILSTTSNIANQEVVHNPRKYGKSSYSLAKLFDLAYNLLINYTSLPLKLIGYLGLFVSLISMFLGIFFIIRKLINGTAPVGWTTIVVLISFYNALIFIFFFFIGEYISRILKEVSGKKKLYIREIIK